MRYSAPTYKTVLLGLDCPADMHKYSADNTKGNKDLNSTDYVQCYTVLKLVK